MKSCGREEFVIGLLIGAFADSMLTLDLNVPTLQIKASFAI